MGAGPPGPHLDARVGLDRGPMAADPLGAQWRDELGMTAATMAQPVQAGTSSAVSFSLGGAVALLAAILTPSGARVPVVAGVALVLLAGTGALGGRFGGAPIGRAA